MNKQKKRVGPPRSQLIGQCPQNMGEHYLAFTAQQQQNNSSRQERHDRKSDKNSAKEPILKRKNRVMMSWTRSPRFADEEVMIKDIQKSWHSSEFGSLKVLLTLHSCHMTFENLYNVCCVCFKTFHRQERNTSPFKHSRKKF